MDCPLLMLSRPFTLRHLEITTGGLVIALWCGHVLTKVDL